MAVGDYQNGPAGLVMRMSGGALAGRRSLALGEVDLDRHGKFLKVVGFDGQERGGFVGIELEARVGDELGAAAVEQACAEMIADVGFTEELVQSNY